MLRRREGGDFTEVSGGLWQSGFPEAADGRLRFVRWGFSHSMCCTVSQKQSLSAECEVNCE